MKQSLKCMGCRKIFPRSKMQRRKEKPLCSRCYGIWRYHNDKDFRMRRLKAIKHWMQKNKASIIKKQIEYNKLYHQFEYKLHIKAHKNNVALIVKRVCH